jgi:hypothetical protein
MKPFEQFHLLVTGRGDDHREPAGPEDSPGIDVFEEGNHRQGKEQQRTNE